MRGEESVQDFGGKARRKEATRKTSLYMGGKNEWAESASELFRPSDRLLSAK
jgi:hypothetical protein